MTTSIKPLALHRLCSANGLCIAHAKPEQKAKVTVWNLSIYLICSSNNKLFGIPLLVQFKEMKFLITWLTNSSKLNLFLRVTNGSFSSPVNRFPWARLFFSRLRPESHSRRLVYTFLSATVYIRKHRIPFLLLINGSKPDT